MLSTLRRSSHISRTLTRSYNFASSSYNSCFGNWDTVDTDVIRKNTVEYLNNFDAQSWFNDPQTTIINGKTVTTGKKADTPDAFGKIVGSQILGDSENVDSVIQHMHNFKPQKDYREAARKIEDDLLHNYGHVLVGNQALDFRKQDGITEVGEWAEAQTVERRLSDLLLESEQRGEINIKRDPSFVGCVSNFSNFLDLSRKVLRHVELGVPCVILSRSNTSQHMYRWTQLLVELADKHGLDKNLITYLCANRKEKQRVMTTFPESPFYTTSSREVAASIKKTSPHLMASTGGPNTMVAEKLTPEIEQAASWSTLIENSGQCTAMRALVSGTDISQQSVEDLFTREAVKIEKAQDSIEVGGFAGLFKDQKFTVEEGYSKMDGMPIAIRMCGENFPAKIEEMWRSTYLDVMTGDLQQEATVNKLSKWLNTHQPITCAVNGVNMPFELFDRIFERTALVVYTVGCQAKPALTAQARPQDGEIFGEFPPRNEMSKFTKFPMVIPSPGPGYNTVYEESYLESKAKDDFPIASISKLVSLVKNSAARGYCQVLGEYLVDACEVSPKVGGGNGGRTVLYGLQRTPKNTISIIRSDNLDEIIIRLIPFVGTNARNSICVSTNCEDVFDALRKCDVACEVQDDEHFTSWCQENDPWNVVRPEDLQEWALVGQFTSTLLPCGHVKSTRGDDTDFIDYMSKSSKWLKVM